MIVLWTIVFAIYKSFTTSGKDQDFFVSYGSTLLATWITFYIGTKLYQYNFVDIPNKKRIISRLDSAYSTIIDEVKANKECIKTFLFVWVIRESLENENGFIPVIASAGINLSTLKFESIKNNLLLVDNSDNDIADINSKWIEMVYNYYNLLYKFRELLKDIEYRWDINSRADLELLEIQLKTWMFILLDEHWKTMPRHVFFPIEIPSDVEYKEGREKEINKLFLSMLNNANERKLWARRELFSANKNLIQCFDDLQIAEEDLISKISNIRNKIEI